MKTHYKKKKLEKISGFRALQTQFSHSISFHWCGLLCNASPRVIFHLRPRKSRYKNYTLFGMSRIVLFLFSSLVNSLKIPYTTTIAAAAATSQYNLCVKISCVSVYHGLATLRLVQAYCCYCVQMNNPFQPLIYSSKYRQMKTAQYSTNLLKPIVEN